MNTCYIIGAGENYGIDLKIDTGDMIIAADGGVKYLKEVNIKPDLIVGDFDSLSFVPEAENVIKLETHKDDTDTFSSIEQGIKRGYKYFVIYCGTGGRVDHTYANIQTLHNLANRNLVGKLIDQNSIYTVIKNSKIEFPEGNKGFVSVFSLSDTSKGVSIEGMEYEVSDITLSNDFPLGVSNELIGKRGLISVKEGTLLIIYPRGVEVTIMV